MSIKHRVDIGYPVEEVFALAEDMARLPERENGILEVKIDSN